MSPLTGVIQESWQLYKAHAKHLLTFSLIVYLITAVVSALLQEVGGLFGALLGALVTLVAVFLLQAALVKAVQDVRDGTADLSVGQTFSAATPFIGSVAAASILAAILITIGLFIVIIPGLILITIWCLIVPVIVLESSGALASFSRSRELVRGYFWNVFGTLALVFVILLALNLVLGAIFVALPVFVRGFLSTVIGGTLVAPFIAVVVTLAYFRLSAAVAGGTATTTYGGTGAVPYGGGAAPYGGGAAPYGAPGDPYATGYAPPGQSEGFPPSQPDTDFPSDGGQPDTGYLPPN